MARNRFSNSNLLALPNCVGLSERGKCMWLNNISCRGDGCRIKRLDSEPQYTQVKIFQRLASLSDSQQAYISDKYYKGKKPWIEVQSRQKA